jgi:hypothetical protein
MSRRPDRLYIFVTSPRPDPYVNILVHATRRFDLKEIHFIGITEHEYQSEAGEQRAATIAAATNDLLDRLAQGKYVDRDQVVDLDEAGAEVYRRCIEGLKYVRTSSEGIRWADLGARVSEFARGGASLFDVTALKKNLLVDAVALLISLGESGVWTFEILKAPTYGVSDLVHNLTEERDYKYRCLTGSRHVEEARKRMILGAVTLRTLIAATAAILVPVLAVQLFWPSTVFQSFIVAIGTTTSIAGWLFFMRLRP